MSKRSVVIAATILFLLAVATVAWAADPFVGTWKLNLEKSKYSPGPPPKSATLKIEAQKNGLKYVTDGVNAQGNPTHAEFAFIYDGKDYPLKATSAPLDLTIAVKKINTNTHNTVLKQAGKEMSTGREVVSKDGKTMTRTNKGKNAQGQEFNNTVVFDKQ